MDEREIERVARAVAEELQAKGWIGRRRPAAVLVNALPVRPSVHPSIRPSVDPTIRPSVYPSIPPSVQPSSRPVPIRPSVQPSNRPVPDHPSIRPSAHPIRVADFIDHTLLKAEATRAEIEKLCAEAKEHRFAAVCVNGCWAARCAELLRGTGVKVAAVAGFPLGAMTSGAKAAETRQLVADGADEIDMVAPIGHILDEDWDYVEDDIRAVVEAARGRTVKVILETAALDPTRIIKAAALAKEAGAAFVKTSTGFHPAGGATAEAVELMRAAVGPTLGVKAAGGIRDCATALRMIAAGANRLGTSSGVKLVDCLGSTDTTLEELLRVAHTHGTSCKTGTCKSDAY